VHLLLGPKLLITEVPRNVILGHKVINRLQKIISELHLGLNCLIITGNVESDIDVEKISDSVKSYVKQTGRTIKDFFMQDTTNSTFETVKKIILDENIHFIIVLGESCTIEGVKYIVKQTHDKIDWISIPTSPVHDGFASPFIFLNSIEGGEEFIGSCKPPIAIIADTEILEQATTRSIKSGIGILLSKFSSNWDWKLASRLRSESISDFTALVSDELILLQANNLKLSSINPNNPQLAITEIMKGLIIRGFLSSFSNNIRASFGSEHMFSQALDHIVPGQTLRGERVALGTIMMASLQGQEWRVIRDFYKSAGVAVTAEELNLKNSSIIKALRNAVQFSKSLSGETEFYTILGNEGLTEDAALRLTYRTGIIGNRPGII
jgi:glycerol-1-phosphate dehydrogenase [NAD(P)+]